MLAAASDRRCRSVLSWVLIFGAKRLAGRCTHQVGDGLAGVAGVLGGRGARRRPHHLLRIAGGGPQRLQRARLEAACRCSGFRALLDSVARWLAATCSTSGVRASKVPAICAGFLSWRQRQQGCRTSGTAGCASTIDWCHAPRHVPTSAGVAGVHHHPHGMHVPVSATSSG